MTTQPEALRLADALENTPNWQKEEWGSNWKASVMQYSREPFEAAAELRRLYEVNQELLKALKLAWPIIEYERFAQDCSYGNNFVQTKAERARGAHEAARAAIAKAEENA